MTTEDRTEIRGKGWTKTSHIATHKFDAVAGAILAALDSTPISFTELVERVATKLTDFDGSVAWYTISCARELEVRGQVLRQAKPVRYSKPGKPGPGKPRREPSTPEKP